MTEGRTDGLLDRALEPLRTGLRADGMDLVPRGVEEGGATLVVQLTFGPEACEECIVPDDVMEAMLLDATRAEGAKYERVRLVREPAIPSGETVA